MTEVDPEERDVVGPGHLCASKHRAVAAEDDDELAALRRLGRIDRHDPALDETQGLLGLGVAGVVASPLPGPSGNVEYFLHLRREAPPLDESELARAIEEGPQ